MTVRILGTGEYVPRRCVSSAELDACWNKSPGWTRQRSGIAQRYYADADEPSSLMAARAAEAALDAAGLSPDEIDCIVSACSVMEQAIPCSAALIQRELGLGESGIPAFDINATCLSFLAALDTLGTTIAAGRYQHVLIVSSEIASAGLSEADAEVSMLFGDGAGAVVIGASTDKESSRILGAHFETYGIGAELCQVRSGGTRVRPHDDVQAFLDGACFQMHGRPMYRMAAQRLPVFLERLLERASVSLASIDRIIPHQASDKALTHLDALLELPAGRLVRTLVDRGNQMAASIPVALHHAVRSGLVKRGDTIALIGSGAGLSFGGAVLVY